MLIASTKQGIIYLLITLLMLGISKPSHANTLDPSLMQALAQAAHSTELNTIDLDSLAWLASMSSKLEQRLPDPFYRIRLLSTVVREAKIANLDPHLVLAVMEVESNFDRYATSHVGAQGLMQIMPFWKDVHNAPDDDLYNPLVSIRYGCKILRHYIDRYSNLTDALAAYNGSLGKAKYPNKVLGRLASRWQFKGDPYSNNTVFKVASLTHNSTPIN